MIPYKLVIFDFDGTLSDSFPWFLRIVNTVAERHKFRRIEDSEVESLRGKTSREIVQFFQIPAWKLPFVARDMRKLKSAHLHDIPLFSGVLQMLDDLGRAGIRIAVVSSDSENNVRQSLGASARYIAAFGCGASLFGKARLFRRVMKLTGTSPTDTICIGDEVRDAEAAAKASTAFGAVTWGYARPEALQRTSPALTFTDRNDIVRKLTGA